MHKLFLVAALSLAVYTTVRAGDSLSSADKLADRGSERLNRGDPEGAAEDFASAIKLDRRSVKAYFGRAALRLRAGLLDRAIEDYTRVVELKPDSPVGFLARGAAIQTGLKRCDQRFQQSNRIGEN